ncbi:MAG: hypothetical protein ACTSRQ_12865 [Candidatus Thorarchaeota archaeon]
MLCLRPAERFNPEYSSCSKDEQRRNHDCKEAFKYFLSDLDFPHELTTLAEVYVKLIRGIKNSLTEVVDEFKVPLPKRWSVKLDCQCGKAYNVEIPLPQL